MPHKVLVVDDDAMIVRMLSRGLTQSGYVADSAGGGSEALDKLAHASYDAILVDLSMPEIDGFQVMRYAVESGRARVIIVITGQGSISVAVAAMRAGAVDFITKPFEPETVFASLKRALGGPADSATSYAQRMQWRDEHAPEIVGNDHKLFDIFGVIERIADTDCTVLITGASGTGKELVAHAIHNSSSRRAGPFVPINCAAVPSELMESEIFGHVKGAFTGANERREGKFQAADGGTLLLDEIGEMDPSLQAKLLRVIQDKRVTPIGSSDAIDVDVRILSATNQDLEARCREGRFREDLFYRLNVVPIHLPSLRQRPGDLPILADALVRRFNENHDRSVEGVNDAVLSAFAAYRWPGNVREMANLLERLVILKGSGSITLEDIPEPFRARSDERFEEIQLPTGGLDIRETMENLEARLTLDALRRSDGNKSKAAALLGLKRTTLIERLKKLKLPDGVF